MNVDVRRELLARFAADQQALSALYEAADRYKADFVRSQATPTETPWPFAILEWQPEEHAPGLVKEALLRVRQNTEFLQQLVAEAGWPGRDLVGEDGADAAWLLLQHSGAGVRTLDSPANRAFRQMCVPLLQRGVASGSTHPRHLAHTVDGIKSVEGGSPTYAVLSSAFESDEDGVRLPSELDVRAIDTSRHLIGLVAVAVDLRLRAQGRSPAAVGGDQPEPWPEHGPVGPSGPRAHLEIPVSAVARRAQAKSEDPVPVSGTVEGGAWPPGGCSTSRQTMK